MSQFNFRYQVNFENAHFRDWPLEGRLEELFSVCHKYLSRFPKGLVNINLVSANTMRKLNRKIYPFKKESDVLALPLNSLQINSQVSNLIGEIYLNYPQSKIQAIKYKHTWLRECAFLVLHAFLHLLDYEHLTPSGEKLMFDLQEAILVKLKIFRNVK